MWGTLSDERTGLSFFYMLLVLASAVILGSESIGTHHHILLSQIVEVEVEVTLRMTVSQSFNLEVEHHLGLMTRYLLRFDGFGLVIVGRPL